ncbi:MAG: ABC transporter permease [Spirochaetales bacterium]|nr:ABC transporter permease [Spirochaetales bacterium]
MWKFFVKRIVMLIPILLGVAFIVFLIFNLAPGDPARLILGFDASEEDVMELREEMGLNDPFFIRYLKYVLSALHGDLGNSYKTGFKVTEQISPKLMNTLKLMVVATVFCVAIAIPLGMLAALKQNSIFDAMAMGVSLLGISLPTFWTGLILIIFFSVQLGILPASGGEGLKSMLLPVMTLSLNGLASIARTTRSSMLDVIHADYIRTAKGKGISRKDVIVKYALPNSLVPILTVVGVQMCFMISGTVLVESIFAWPGMGRLLVSSVNDRDFPLTMGCIITFAICFSLINLGVDILYGVVDPRIKAQYKK